MSTSTYIIESFYVYAYIFRVPFEANVEQGLKEQNSWTVLQRFAIEILNARKVAIIIIKLKMN